jgi:hypothetical protein
MDSTEIAELEDQRFQAMVERDVGALDRLIDDHGFFLDSTGRPQSKDDILKKFRTGSRQYQRIDVTERRLNLTKQRAISTGYLSIIEKVGGKLVQASVRYMAIYAEQAGWRLVSWQATRTA